MLREVGKRDIDVLHDYLEANSHAMARTTLRYSIERMSPPERKHWLTDNLKITFSPNKGLCKTLFCKRAISNLEYAKTHFGEKQRACSALSRKQAR